MNTTETTVSPDVLRNWLSLGENDGDAVEETVYIVVRRFSEAYGKGRFVRVSFTYEKDLVKHLKARKTTSCNQDYVFEGASLHTAWSAAFKKVVSWRGANNGETLASFTESQLSGGPY